MERKVKKLIEKFRSPNGDTRLRTVNELVDIGEPAVRPLIDALGDEKIIHLAWTALCLIGKHSAKPLIEALIAGKHEELVVSALVEIGAPAIKPLMELHNSNDAHLVEKTLEVIVRMGEEAVAPLITVLKSGGIEAIYAGGCLGYIGPLSLNQLKVLQHDMNVSETQRNVAGFISEQIKKSFADYINSALKDEYDEEYEKDLIALGDIALEPLAVNLSPGDSIEGKIARIMMNIGGPSINLLNRVVEIDKLGEFKITPPDGQLLEELIQYLGRADGDFVKKCLILFVFSYIESDGVEKALKQALSDENELIAAKAAKALQYREQLKL